MESWYEDVSLPVAVTVNKFCVDVGDRVFDDQALFHMFVQESQGETVFLSNMQGKITKIFVETGSIVPQDTPILRIVKPGRR